MTRTTLFLLFFAALASTGCEASNAVLDVRMGMPPNPSTTEAMFARVLVARGNFPVPENVFVPQVHELTAGRSTYEFSIEDETLACDPTIPGDCDVLVEVRFCLDRNCAGLCPACPGVRSRDPQAVIRYRLERPLFVGQRTEWEPTISQVPSCSDEPSVCDSVEPPTDPDCVVDPTAGETGGAPTYLCVLDHCEHILCTAEPTGSAGSCTEGRSGPHWCDR